MVERLFYLMLTLVFIVTFLTRLPILGRGQLKAIRVSPPTNGVFFAFHRHANAQEVDAFLSSQSHTPFLWQAKAGETEAPFSFHVCVA